MTMHSACSMDPLLCLSQCVLFPSRSSICAARPLCEQNIRLSVRLCVGDRGSPERKESGSESLIPVSLFGLPISFLTADPEYLFSFYSPSPIHCLALNTDFPTDITAMAHTHTRTLTLGEKFSIRKPREDQRTAGAVQRESWNSSRVIQG
jgi:hypothetical protein